MAVTAAMIFSGGASPSTVREAASSDTVAFLTPSTLRAALSTAAEQAAHVIPVMSYIFFMDSLR